MLRYNETMRRIYTAAVIALTITAFFGCKKDNKIPEPTTGPKTGTASELVKDSIYYIAKETYFWTQNLPVYSIFNPRNYTGSNDLAAFNAEVLGLAQFSTNKYDILNGDTKYSFVDNGNVASSIGGNGTSFGFSLIYNYDGTSATDPSDLRVKYVYPGSPAGNANLVRGYQITKINGRTALAYDANPTTGAYGANLTFVTNALGSDVISMTLKKPDGTTFDVSLAASGYTLKPVVKTAVIDAGNGKKVGYISYLSFTSLSNSQSAFDQAFATFAASGVTDLVIDIRYNGGGSVETAEYLSNLIAPSSKTGSLMYTTIWASPMQNGPAPYLQKKLKEEGYSTNLDQFKEANNKVNFDKKGTLNLSGKVYFLVSGSTASASELVVNNSLPTGNVQLIGKNSYGKPVGFFAIPFYTSASRYYDVYLAQFETKNAANQGEYFSGMLPGSSAYPGKLMSRDDVTHDFGDPQETWLAQVLSNVKTGAYSVALDEKLMSANKSGTVRKVDMSIIDNSNLSIEEKLHPFNGMVWNRRVHR